MSVGRVITIVVTLSADVTANGGREQRRSEGARAEFTLPAVARRLPRPTAPRRERRGNRRVTAGIREFGARGRGLREVRAATSVRRAGVKRSCAAFGLPRVVGGCEGAKCSTTARAGGRVLL